MVVCFNDFVLLPRLVGMIQFNKYVSNGSFNHHLGNEWRTHELPLSKSKDKEALMKLV